MQFKLLFDGKSKSFLFTNTKLIFKIILFNYIIK